MVSIRVRNSHVEKCSTTACARIESTSFPVLSISTRSFKHVGLGRSGNMYSGSRFDRQMFKASTIRVTPSSRSRVKPGSIRTRSLRPSKPGMNAKVSRTWSSMSFVLPSDQGTLCQFWVSRNELRRKKKFRGICHVSETDAEMRFDVQIAEYSP